MPHRILDPRLHRGHGGGRNCTNWCNSTKTKRYQVSSTTDLWPSELGPTTGCRRRDGCPPGPPARVPPLSSHNKVAGGVMHLTYCYRHCFRLASPSYDRTCEYALYYCCYCVESQGKRTHKMHELRVAIACCAVLIGRGVVHPLCPVRCALPLYIRSAVVIPPAPRVRCVLPLYTRTAVW